MKVSIDLLRDRLQKFLHAWMYDFPILRYQGAGRDFVIEIKGLRMVYY